MAATEIKVQMQQRRDTAAGWTSAGTVLLAGELGYETDTGYAKLGDGSTDWASLAYLPAAGKAKDGTESAPGISFASDSDTGIYRPGPNQFGIATAGTSRIVVKSGKVGVGTTSPETTAHVFANNPILRIQDSSTSASDAFAAIQLAESGSNGTLDNYWQIALEGDSNSSTDHLTFKDRTSEVMRIDSSGRLLSNTTTVLESSSAARLHIAHTSGALIALGRNDTAVADGNDMGKIAFYGNDSGTYEKCAEIRCEAHGSHGTGDKPGRLVFATTANDESTPVDHMVIDRDGNVGISTTSPDFKLDVNGSVGVTGLLIGTTTSIGGEIDIVTGSGGQLALARNDSGSTVSGNSLGSLRFYGNQGGTYNDVGRIICSASGDHSSTSKPTDIRFFTTSSNATSASERLRITSSGNIHINGTSAATANITLNANGSATFAGAVSKGSGSFKISHPLPSKTETHHLVHSFIEGPQADLIYRGYVDLVNGQATVNIDTAARMTEGTFEVLCTNVSCFTSNESDWTAVKGLVTGNVLTITAQDPTATSKVSWMVVGERKDQHMLDAKWTDAAGRVITEPEKVVEETEESETEAG